MNNIVENVIATIIVTVLSTLVGIVLQAVGLSPQQSFVAAAVVLLALVLLFFVIKRYYPRYISWLTERLLEKALRVDTNKDSEAEVTFKKKIVGRVLQENPGVELKQNNWITEFPNQEACESQIRNASRNARKVRILTIRGEKYFLGSRSLLHDLISSKRLKNSDIEVLVLAPESHHITDELAKEMGQHSAKEIKGKMRVVLDILKDIAQQNKNFKVRCYDETPNFKILLFDDVMFVSAFTEPKNDRNAKMFRITREEEPLFTGLERHFDDLWNRSASPQ